MGRRNDLGHPPTAAGVGTSHYVIPISATTWCVIAQDNSGMNGIWRTSTAGRMGGTLAMKYRDGTISTAAWSKVSDIEHMHGSFEAFPGPGKAWYVAGYVSIGKSTDEGATWQKIATGNWPNTFAGVRSSNIVVTGKYVYTNFQPDPQHARALLTDDTKWDRAYTAMTTATGGNPFGTAVSYSSLVGKYVIVMSSESDMWRYIEP